MGNVFGLSGKKMTLSEIEKKGCEKTVAACVEKRGAPIHVCSPVDLGFRMQGQVQNK